MMGAVNIDTASSYSDIDSNLGDDPENRVSSSATRILPDWSSTSSLNARAQVAPSADAEIKAPSSATRRLPNWPSTSSLNARAQEIDASSSATTRKLPNWSSPSSLNARVQGNRGKYIKGFSHKRSTHGDSDFHSSSGTGLSGSAKQNHSVVQFDRRALPSSFHPSASQTKPNNVRHADHITRGCHNDVTTLDKSGSRILPSWMCPSQNSSGRNASSADPLGDCDEKMAGPDESSVFQAVMQDFNQPKEEVDGPDGLLSVPLLRHQKIALAWMCQKEARPFCTGGILADDQGLGKTVSIIALILMHKHSEQKSISEDQHIQKSESLNFDDPDDDGLINLVAVELTEDSEGTKSSSKACSPHKQRAAAGTLVVCPATVLRQWYRELNDKVTGEANLQVLMYHGSSRTKDPSELAKYDVVLTTYAIVANEVPKELLVDEDDADAEHKAREDYGLPAEISLDKRKIPFNSRKKGKKGRKGVHSCSSDDSGALARVNWLRVVLDEAQMIKNHRTQVARACWGLRGKKRWCLSGTPIQNTVDELFSYFRFLKYDPYSSYRAFCEGIKGPISRDSQYGYQKLQAVLRTVMLRRTKGTLIDGEPVISLPPKFIQMKSVNFTLEEREFYAKLEAESRSQFKAYALAGTVRQNYANILLMLLRLRQACDHPLLACGFGSDSVRKMSPIKTLKELSKDTLMNLLNCLEGSRICQLCADPPEDAVVAICGHVFCDQCLLDHFNGDDLTCPASRCKEQLGNDIVFSEVTLRSWLSDGSESSSLSKGDQCDENLFMLSSEYCSSKIKAALEILKSLGESTSPCVDLDGTIDHNVDSAVRVRTQTLHSAPSDRPKKAIVFSQWTRMLDLMETSLQQSNFQYRRLDGTMTLAARDKAVREFGCDPEVTVMLMSLKAGNLGLNMVAACHVILLDLWWNPTTEDQAVDRAHRIGQVHPVTVSRLTIKDTVEDRILALQEQKRKMVASAFGDENGDVSASRLDLHDLKFLFTGV